MKKILVIILVLGYGNLMGQKFLKHIPVHIDIKLIDSLTIQLRNKNIDTVFYFLTHLKDEDLTYFFWSNKGEMNIIKINDRSISKVRKIKLSFYKCLNIKKLAIEESENKYKLIPPMGHSEDCDIFIFDSKKNKYLIESGNSTGFILNKIKEKARLQFMKYLKNELGNIIEPWEIESSYKRYSN